MEKTLNSYECMYIIDAGLDEAAIQALVEKFKNLVTEEKGELENVDEWGKRRLAYEIDHLNEGDYTLIDFHADATQIAELDRVLRINDAVKRHMIVRRPDKD